MVEKFKKIDENILSISIKIQETLQNFPNFFMLTQFLVNNHQQSFAKISFHGDSLRKCEKTSQILIFSNRRSPFIVSINLFLSLPPLYDPFIVLNQLLVVFIKSFSLLHPLNNKHDIPLRIFRLPTTFSSVSRPLIIYL